MILENLYTKQELNDIRDKRHTQYKTFITLFIVSGSLIFVLSSFIIFILYVLFERILNKF